MTSAKLEVERIDARRIGLLSDTHFMALDGSDVPQALLDAFRGVDLILHLGHISSSAALDRLESVAPVLAVQTELDDQLLGERLAGEQARGRTKGHTRVIAAGGLRIGAAHDLQIPLEEEHLVFPETSLGEILRAKFGGPVDVVAFAATHIDIAAYRQGVLLVNPGSPNLPAGHREGGPGTVAMLDVHDGTAHVSFVEVAKS